MVVAIWIFVGLAVISYPFLLLFNLIVSPTSGDSLDAGLAGFFTGIVCFNLSIAFLLIAIRGGARWWSWIIAPILMLVYVATAATMPGLIKDHQPVRWMLSVPIAGPLFMFAYIVWAMIPRFHSLLSPAPAVGILYASLFLLLAIPFNRETELSVRQDAAREKWQAPIKARRAKLKNTPADAPIADYLEFLVYAETDDDAKRRIRTSPRRQSDFIQMMNSGDFRFVHMADQLDLTPTPEVCECVRKWLRYKVSTAKSGEDDPQYRFLRYNALDVSVLVWFADRKCQMIDEIVPYEALLRSYPDANADYLQSTFVTLAEIKRKLKSL